MLVLHHLNHSRSQRVVWLMEELDLDYELIKHQRIPPFLLSPPELYKVTSLGKAPYLVDDDIKMTESGAIMEYLINRYGDGKLGYGPDSAYYAKYLMLMHFIEGTLAMGIILDLVNKTLGGNKLLVRKAAEDEMKKTVKFMSNMLGDDDYLINNEFSVADIHFWFLLEAMIAQENSSNQKKLPEKFYTYLNRLHERPAFQRAIEKGGEFDLSVFAENQNQSVITTILKSMFSRK